MSSCHNAVPLRVVSPAGTFKENLRAAEAERANQNESITLFETKDMQSHTYQFEAWTRARGEAKARRMHHGDGCVASLAYHAYHARSCTTATP